MKGRKDRMAQTGHGHMVPKTGCASFCWRAPAVRRSSGCVLPYSFRSLTAGRGD